MKDNEIKKGIQDIQKFALSPTEKETMLQHINAYVGLNPQSATPIKSPFVIFSEVLVKRSYVYVAIVLLLAIVGTSTALASENALPGDPLYPVKIHVTEPIRGVFKLTPKARTEWESEKAVRRLQEGETLAEEGHLNVERRQIIEREFEKNADSFQEASDKNKEDSNHAEKSKFEEKVTKELEKIKKKIEDSSLEQKDQVNNLEVNVQGKLKHGRGHGGDKSEHVGKGGDQ